MRAAGRAALLALWVFGMEAHAFVPRSPIIGAREIRTSKTAAVAERARNDVGMGTPREGRTVDVEGGRVARGRAAPGLAASRMAGDA